MQMLQNEAVYRAQITQIIAEEQAKFNPGVDRPGTLHDRIMARIDQANQQFQAQAPASLAKDYQVRGTTVASQSSYSVASHENQIRNTFGKAQLDKISGQLNAQVQANPDSAFSAVNQMKQALNDLGPTSGLTEAQKSQMLDGYMTALGKNAAAGYMKQGRTEDGKAFVDKFVADRNADQVAKVKSSINPMAYDTKLSPEDEAKFQDWKAKYAPNDSGQDYDLRGAYKAGVTPDPNTGHMPDTFKKPNHPTFSNESQYAPQSAQIWPGKWTGPNHDQFVPPKIMRPGSPGAPGVHGGSRSAKPRRRQAQSAAHRQDRRQSGSKGRHREGRRSDRSRSEPAQGVREHRKRRKCQERQRPASGSFPADQGRVWDEQRRQGRHPQCRRQRDGGSQRAGAEKDPAHPAARARADGDGAVRIAPAGHERRHRAPAKSRPACVEERSSVLWQRRRSQEGDFGQCSRRTL